MDKRFAIKVTNDYIINLIKHNYNIKQAYIFGSYAKGNYTKDSDIDLALVISGINDLINTQVDMLNLRRNTDETYIEPHPIEESDFNNDNPFAFEILKTGLKINLDNLKIV